MLTDVGDGTAVLLLKCHGLHLIQDQRWVVWMELQELISARKPGYLFDSSSQRYKCRPIATVRSILTKRRIVLLIGGISEQRVSRFQLEAGVDKVKREYVQIDARHGEDVHRIIAARGSLSCDNLCTEDWVFVMQAPENESCLTYQMRHASQGPNVSWRGKKRQEKLDTAVMILICSGAWDR